MEDAKYEEHPSWGMVQFSRGEFTGKKRLFGSSLERHGSTISLRIFRGSRKHHLSEDWYLAKSLTPLIEVELSAAQFAGLLTTMNVGDGVPCTIRYVEGKKMPDPPDDSREAERVRESFQQHLNGITEQLGKLLDKADVALMQPLKAGGRKDLREQLHRIRQEIESNLPFVLHQFERATEKITTAAKSEVDAFVTEAATRLGLAKLRELVSSDDAAAPKQLEDSHE